MNRNIWTNHRNRGSALVLAIVMSVILSAVISAIAYVASSQTVATRAMARMDQTYYAADAGAQRVAWYVRNLQYQNGGALLTTLSALPHNTLTNLKGESYTYNTTCSPNSDLSVKVTSVGTYGTTSPNVVSYTMTMKITPPVQGIPTYATAGDWDNQNTTVTGDIAVGGNFSSQGNGTIDGNLYYGGTATDLDEVSGVHEYTSTFDTLNWTTMLSTLDSAAKNPTLGKEINGDLSDTTIDFGNYSVIKVYGNVTNPTFKGSGTLYVTGTVTFKNQQTADGSGSKNTGSIGTAGAPVNLVVAGSVQDGSDSDLTFSATTEVWGSLYVQGDWIRKKTTVNGMVYVGGLSKLSQGSSTMSPLYNSDGTMSIPWFDPRGTDNKHVSVPMTISSFTGPQP